MISLKFIPLTFITSNDEIIRQIKINTVVFSHLFETCEETTFSNYIETTQYGFTASALENGSHRMLRITDIHHSKVNWESVPFCDCTDDEKYLLKDNDILVARTGGTTGKSFFVENPPSNAVFASYLIRIRLKKDVNIEFINTFLNSYCFWSQIVEMKGGSAQPNVNAEKLKVLVMPDCDLEIQAKAVRLIKEENSSNSIRERIDEVESVFWNSNQISTELNHQLALVKELRQAYLREAMQGKLVPQDERDEPAEILLEKIKAEKEKLAAEKRIRRDKPLPPINAEEIPFEIPSNWTWCRLGEIAEIVRGGSPRPAGDKRFYDGEIPFLKVGDLTAIDEIYLNSHTYTIKEAGLHKTRMVEADTLMLTNSGATLGIPKICTFQTTFNDGIAAFLNLVFMDKKFLYYFLKSKSQWYLETASRGQGQPNLNTDIIGNTPLALPPLAEQERIVAKLEKLMKFCDELEVSIKQGITNADRLLQTALKEALESK